MYSVIRSTPRLSRAELDASVDETEEAEASILRHTAMT